jgi:SAM-dependent methyltransferase
MVTERLLTGRSYQNVMEMGCGTGKNTRLLTRLSRQILAVDFSPGMLQHARSKIDSQNVFFVVADLTKPWPCKTEAFELIVCNLVLEHIEDLTAIFLQASQALAKDGLFFISELHPFRQYQGTQAVFQREQGKVKIPAFVHHLSDFTSAAQQHGFVLRMMNEWWHEKDQNKPPRLVSFMFEKPIHP